VRTDEQRQLAESLRALLEAESPEPRVRDVAGTATGVDEPLWRRLRELGVVGLGVPEESGGQGGGIADLAVAFAEAGRALACVPLLSVSAALAVLAVTDTDPARAALRRLAGGERRATPALAEGGRWSADGLTTRVGPDGTVTGRKEYVLDAATAAEYVVLAAGATGPVLVLVDRDGPGVEVREAAGLDTTRRFGTVTLTGAQATVLASGDAAVAAVATGLDRAAVLLATEQAGGARRCLDDSVAYARVREQFGAPIGSFQSIKHRCADMLLLVEGAEAVAGAAGAALDAGVTGPELELLVGSAGSYCAEAFVACAGENIQIHGGIGFTWEHSAHLFLRRAKSGAALFGGPARYRERVVAGLEAGVPADRG
jgi:alkylation response protein AidB-like acyl-CoA dehydrogenase